MTIQPRELVIRDKQARKKRPSGRGPMYEGIYIYGGTDDHNKTHAELLYIDTCRFVLTESAVLGSPATWRLWESSPQADSTTAATTYKAKTFFCSMVADPTANYSLVYQTLYS